MNSSSAGGRRAPLTKVSPTPVPGGLTSREALQLMRALRGVRLVGMDVVEVCPPLDHADVTSHLAAHVLFEGWRSRRWPQDRPAGGERRGVPSTPAADKLRSGAPTRARRVQRLDLLVVRHAIAEDRETFAAEGKPDAERPLTDDGRRRFERAARGLRRIVGRIDVLATSTLARAIETGEILAAELRVRRATRLAELAPDAEPRALMPWLRRNASRPCVAIVGHEPHLSLLVEYLLTGTPGRGFVALRKGGACLLSMAGRPVAGRAELGFLLTAGQLRRLA